MTKLPLSKILEYYRIIQSIKPKDDERTVMYTFKITKLLISLKKKIEEYEKAIREASKPSDKFNEYEAKRMELVTKYAKKNKDGSIMTDKNGNAVLSEANKKKFNEEFNKLAEEYKEVIEKRKQQREEVNKLLEQEIDISELDIKPINIDLFPNSINEMQMEALIMLGIIEEQ